MGSPHVWKKYIGAEIESAARMVGGIGLVTTAQAVPLEMPPAARLASDLLMKESLEKENDIIRVYAALGNGGAAIIPDYINPWWRKGMEESELPTPTLVYKYFAQQHRLLPPIASTTSHGTASQSSITTMTYGELLDACEVADDTVRVLDNQLEESTARLGKLDDTIKELRRMREEMSTGQREQEAAIALLRLMAKERSMNMKSPKGPGQLMSKVARPGRILFEAPLCRTKAAEVLDVSIQDSCADNMTLDRTQRFLRPEQILFHGRSRMDSVGCRGRRSRGRRCSWGSAFRCERQSVLSGDWESSKHGGVSLSVLRNDWRSASSHRSVHRALSMPVPGNDWRSASILRSVHRDLTMSVHGGVWGAHVLGIRRLFSTVQHPRPYHSREWECCVLRTVREAVHGDCSPPYNTPAPTVAGSGSAAAIVADAAHPVSSTLAVPPRESGLYGWHWNCVKCLLQCHILGDNDGQWGYCDFSLLPGCGRRDKCVKTPEECDILWGSVPGSVTRRVVLCWRGWSTTAMTGFLSWWQRTLFRGGSVGGEGGEGKFCEEPKAFWQRSSVQLRSVLGLGSYLARDPHALFSHPAQRTGEGPSLELQLRRWLLQTIHYWNRARATLKMKLKIEFLCARSTPSLTGLQHSPEEVFALCRTSAQTLTLALEQAESWAPPLGELEGRFYLAEQIDSLLDLTRKFSEAHAKCRKYEGVDLDALGVTKAIELWVAELFTHRERYNTEADTFDASFFTFRGNAISPLAKETQQSGKVTPFSDDKKDSQEEDNAKGNNTPALGNHQSVGPKRKDLHGPGSQSDDDQAGRLLAKKRKTTTEPERDGPTGPIDETTDTELEQGLPTLYRSRRTDGMGRAFVEPCSRCKESGTVCLITTTGKTRMVACLPCAEARSGGCTKSTKAKGKGIASKSASDKRQVPAKDQGPTLSVAPGGGQSPLADGARHSTRGPSVRLAHTGATGTRRSKRGESARLSQVPRALLSISSWLMFWIQGPSTPDEGHPLAVVPAGSATIKIPGRRSNATKAERSQATAQVERVAPGGLAEIGSKTVVDEVQRLSQHKRGVDADMADLKGRTATIERRLGTLETIEQRLGTLDDLSIRLNALTEDVHNTLWKDHNHRIDLGTGKCLEPGGLTSADTFEPSPREEENRSALERIAVLEARLDLHALGLEQSVVKIMMHVSQVREESLHAEVASNARLGALEGLVAFYRREFIALREEIFQTKGGESEETLGGGDKYSSEDRGSYGEIERGS
ncbi:hypothetical protein DFP72DRAFT_843937 [Ephemerocybe angulata]|uniref:Uncharacterized protein n=1 Tax=Ephemerocybe angulata TaxID=980116 RepID=A0A8H6I6P6_9AGAR|nr:hypothetical protein DFP72DRAFT_843937 [Tulosesus angulatus]